MTEAIDNRRRTTDDGERLSHGCVNLPLAQAEWLWNWAAPPWDAQQAARVASAKPLQAKDTAEAALQPLEGLAVFRQGATVVVHS